VLLSAALVLPVAAAAGVWQWQAAEHRDAQASLDKDQAALAAAREQTLAWASVDYRTVDDYIAKVEAGATGDFLTQFQQSEKPLRQLLAANKSVQVPTIPDDGVGLLERDGDEARVLIAMDATVTNKSTKTPQPRQYRLQVTVVDEDGHWLTKGLEFIDAQP
jgi:Mce-associated membrane protein